MGMSQKDRERLAKIRDAKRENNGSPARISVDHFKIACDFATDFPRGVKGWCYLRWFPGELQDVLMARFPYAKLWVKAGLKKSRVVYVYQKSAIFAIFAFLLIDNQHWRGVTRDPPHEIITFPSQD